MNILVSVFAALVLWLLPVESHALCAVQTGTITYANNFVLADPTCNANGFVNMTPASVWPGEDATAGVIKVEQQFTHSAITKVDAQVKATAGFLHCILITQDDAAPTAGTIVVYDNPAETGTAVFNWTLTTAVFLPMNVCLDVVMTSGIYIGFTTTADVNVSVSYR